MWEIDLRGDGTALGILRDSFPGPGIRVWEGANGFLLSSSDWDPLDDVREVRERAERLMEALGGAVRLILGWSGDLVLGGAARVDPDGKRHYFLVVDSAKMEIRANPVTLTTTHPDGTTETARPGDPAVEWLDLAQKSEAVRRALAIFSHPDLSWVDLTNILDIIEEDTGKDRLGDWITAGQLRLLRRTANSFASVGRDARHGNLWDPPAKPTTLPTAKSLVQSTLRQWLDSKVSDDPSEEPEEG